jgi:hypothetical protein
MSTQTKTVMIVFLAGVALVFLIEASGAVRGPVGYIPPIDMTGPINADRSFRIGHFMGHWAVHWAVMGLIPLMLAAIAIAATAYKAGLRSSIFNALGAAGGVVCLPIVISGAQVAIAATRPMKELPFAEASTERDSFVRGALSGCAKKLQKVPENKRLSAAAIDEYCSCSANSLADFVTKDDIASMAQHEAASSMADKVNTVSQKCLELALGRQ